MRGVRAVKLEDVLRSMAKKEPLTFEEIGLVLGMRRQNVFATYRRAMAKLRARLIAMGADGV